MCLTDFAMESKIEIIQINISGEDKPGMTSSLTDILARYDAFILDIGQANIHQSLTLGILFMTTSDKSGAILKELLFKASELGVMIRFTPITEEHYQAWVGRQGKNRYIITLLGRQVTARHIAGVTKAVAEQGLNIDAIKRLTGRMPLEEENRATRACIELSVRGTLGDKAVLQKRFMELSNEGVDISFQKDDIYRRSRRESEAVLKELRSMKADFDTKRLEQAAEEARKKLNKTLSEDAPLPEGAPLSAKTAKKGLNVFVVSLGKNGIITDVNGNDVTVQVGILKMTVPAKKCLLTKAQPAHTDAAPKKRKGFSKNAAANYAHQMFIAKSGSAKQEIDLRGMTLDEAIPVVDKAIDDALIAGIGQLRLIHGKGTGALRAGLTAYLSTNRFVKKLETAALEAGGSGATVIDL